MEDKLIVAVSGFPELYDSTSVMYRDRNKKERAWLKVSDIIGVPEDICRKKWKGLRDTYLKERRKDKKRSGSAAGSVKKWKYSAVLSFLDPFITPRVTTGNMGRVVGELSQAVDVSMQSEAAAERQSEPEPGPSGSREFERRGNQSGLCAEAVSEEEDDGEEQTAPVLRPPTGLNLPLSSMRLLVPPVRLMSAYMWQVAQQRCVDQYEKLAEFISLVTQMVPELLSFRQRAQLILGLRARLTLELLQRAETFDPQAIEDTLRTVCQWTTNCMQEEGQEEEVEVSKLNFLELVQTLLSDPSERKHFFENVFPVQYGACFDTALQILVWEFLSRLEEFLPVPRFSQIASSSSPVGVEQFFLEPEDLKMLLQHQKHDRKLKKNQFSFESDTILSTLASKLTSEVCKDQDEHTMKNTRGLVENQQKSERSLQRQREKEETKTSQENKLSEGDTHEEEEEGTDEGSNEALGSNFQQQQEEEPSLLRAPLSSPETDTEIPVNNKRKVKYHLRRKDRNPGVERIQGSTGDGAEDLLPSSRPNSCSTEITKKHSCPQCGKSFRSLCDLKRHNTVHIFVKPFKCNQCEVRFKTKYYLKNHLRIHTGHKPHICSYCSRAFKTKDILKEHLRTHTGERPYACTLCEKKFTQMNILKVHLRVHKGERPYLCSDCGKAFCDSSSLLVHSRTHTGERPYHCDVCGKDYITSQRLKTHQRFHTGERPYPCPDCEKCFHTHGGLKKHIRTHTGEKPFQCLRCDKRFSEKSNMRVHLRSHR